MYILTNENRTYELDHIPDTNADVRYGVFDFSDKKFTDYFFLPLVFLESFYAPAIVMEIGEFTVKMPMDWSIVACDEGFSDIEIIPLTSLNDRGFCAILFNPLNHMVPEVKEVNIVNVYAEVKWFFPKLKNNNFLVVPVELGDTPRCLLFIKDVTRLAETVDISDIFS